MFLNDEFLVKFLRKDSNFWKSLSGSNLTKIEPALEGPAILNFWDLFESSEFRTHKEFWTLEILRKCEFFRLWEF